MIRFFLLIAVVLAVSSCKEDLPHDDNAPIEAQYFEDYESPRLKWGYIDTRGEVVISPIYDDVRDMKSDLTAANYKGKWGFINNKNEPVIDFKYKQVLDFDKKVNRAFVQSFDNEWLLIDKADVIIDSLPYNAFKTWTDEYCPVSVNGLWGIIDKSGKEVLSPQYLYIDIVSKERVIAKQYDKYGIVDINNQTVEGFDYKRITAVSDNIIRFRTKAGYYYQNLLSGKKSKNFDKAGIYENERAIVSDGKKTIVLDNAFVAIKEFDYQKLQHAGEGYFKFKENDKWGLIDPDFNIIREADLYLLNKYQEGHILYALASDRWGYLDKNGEIFLPAELPIAWEYKNGYARIFHSKGVGFIDTTKNLVVDRRMFEVRDFYNGLARFQSLR